MFLLLLAVDDYHWCEMLLFFTCQLLGDKAYVGKDDIFAPFKKPPRRQLVEEEKKFNDLHSW